VRSLDVPGARSPRPPLLVDVDMGLDDVRVLAALPGQDRFEVVGVVTVEGSAGAARGAENALRLLASLGAHRIPVAVGARRALARDVAPPPWRPMTEALGGLAPTLPPARRHVERAEGARFIAGALRRAPLRSVRLLALGPLTNLALAFRGDRELTARVHSLHLLGDFLRCDCYNCRTDPEAARAVLALGLPTLMVVRSATDRAPFDDALLARVAALHGPGARLVASVMRGHPTGQMKLWDDSVLAGLLDSRLLVLEPDEAAGLVRRATALHVEPMRALLLTLWDRSGRRDP
jgi:inosine-uridine nucleoside N-ribohydrolase